MASDDQPNSSDLDGWRASIKFADFTKRHNFVLQDRGPDTSQWFLEHSDFKAWLQSKDATNLLLTGSAGSGKTYIAATVIDYIQNHRGDHDAGIAFFYIDIRQHATFVEFLASLLHQLWSTKKNLVLATSSGQPSSADKLVTMLKMVTRELSQVFIIVDALDEWTTSTAGFITRLFEVQLELGAKLFVTSRRLAILDSIIAKTKTAEISIDANPAPDSDFDHFVTQEVEKIPGLDAEASYEIRKNILENSKGFGTSQYLSAKLVLARIHEATSPEAARAIALQKVPTSLSEYYDNIWHQIDSYYPEELRLAKDALMWVS